MKRLAFAFGFLALLFGLSGVSCGRRVTLATYNIRMFPEEGTDRARLLELFLEIDADIVAVQEIRDEDALLAVLRAASARSGRELRLALSTCGGPANIKTGLVYDANAVRLLGTRQFKEHNADDSGDCAQKYRAALLGVFESGSERLAVLSVHMQHGPAPEQLAARKRQWAGVIAILAEARIGYDAEVVALGDFNSTGFQDDGNGERSFIEATLDRAGLSLATEEIGCTAYWQPSGRQGSYVPSILDHMVVSGRWEAPTALGMCAALSCQQSSKAPHDYERVSDHCPLRITR